MPNLNFAEALYAEKEGHTEIADLLHKHEAKE